MSKKEYEDEYFSAWSVIMIIGSLALMIFLGLAVTKQITISSFPTINTIFLSEQIPH